MPASSSTVPASPYKPQGIKSHVNSHRYSWAPAVLGRSLPEFITPLAVVYHWKEEPSD